MAKKMSKELQDKLEYIERQNRATAPGFFPGMNRARKFKNKKKHANKYKCRKKVEW